jgi:urease subunit gamma
MSESVARRDGDCANTCWRNAASAASFPETVRENEEVVPVYVSTWVLPFGVTVGR